MIWSLPQASDVAGRVDLIFLALLGLAFFFVALIGGAILYFSIKYRAGSDANRDNPPQGSTRLEIAWAVIPLLLGVPIFLWAANVYLNDASPPDDALSIYVVAKQWMWQIEHPDGQREINELHVPVNRPVKLIMASEDVIHSFWVPSFRIKQDVLPGRYTSLWFTATKPGQFDFLCAEYCGAQHSGMIGTVFAMEPSAYQDWLSGGVEVQSTQARGEQLFNRLGCDDCHHPDGSGDGPSLVGVFGSPVQLEGGGTVTADENYIRESILKPQAKIVAGYEPVMPTFEGQVDEQDLIALVNYIRSLGGEAGQNE